VTAIRSPAAELRRRLRTADPQEVLAAVVAILNLEKRRMRIGREPDFQPVASRLAPDYTSPKPDTVHPEPPLFPRPPRLLP